MLDITAVWDAVVDAVLLGDLNRFSDGLVKDKYQRFMQAVRIREALRRFGDRDEATAEALNAVNDLVNTARQEFWELVQRIGY